jgi:hypothetical protein
MKSVLILLFAVSTATAQWPGYFYTFEFKDKSGKSVDSNNTGYKMETVKADKSSDIMLSIKICEDNKTWRFYEGGYHDLDKTHKLKITELSTDDEMTIEFPSSLSGGKEKYYRNLYAGEIKFKKGKYKVRLPSTDNEWDNLAEKNVCPLSYMTTTYYDISGFQK